MGELVQQPARVQAAFSGPPFHVWTLPDAAPWAEFHRAGGGILVRFPGYADFEISADGLGVIGTPAPETTDATLEHLFLNQVLPLALGRQGKLVFHASAVAVPGGAVAFIAGSGFGKSTLAMAFACGGDGFLTDDSLVLERMGGRYLVQPGHPSIRLWEDSEQALSPAGTSLAVPVSYTDKARLLAGPGLAHCDGALPLLAAYVLDDAGASGVSIAPLTPATAVLEWTRHAFLLDIQDKALVGDQFRRAVELAEAVPCYTLDFPRDYALLGRVRERVIAHSSLKSAA